VKTQRIRIIYDKDEPIRLDKHLANLRLQELHSRSFIESLISEDRILVNNVPVKKSYPLEKGDEISLKLPEPPDYEMKAEDIPLEVLYEDEHLAIINKEAGMIVHPGHGNPDGTLVNAILYRFGNNLSTGRDPNRPGIVHRLDRGTSGLIVIAKTDQAQVELNHMFARREIHKTYLAITTGIPNPPDDTIECSIGRSLNNPRQMCVTENGKLAISHYKTIHYYHYFALVKVKLETGRMHQIRVQFAHRHTPILGDLLYNTRRQVHALLPQNMKRKATELLANHLHRQALHSWRLQFIHPITDQPIDIYAPLPRILSTPWTGWKSILLLTHKAIHII
jgi:23S rRNA pseudouridine1911/1915/1917 synthase